MTKIEKVTVSRSKPKAAAKPAPKATAHKAAAPKPEIPSVDIPMVQQHKGKLALAAGVTAGAALLFGRALFGVGRTMLRRGR
jgi:hypothetical protein